MAKTIIQNVTFKVSPQVLYGIYTNAKKHAAAIDSIASLDPKVGGNFSAFGMLKGKFLYLLKNKIIVQTWRAKSWKKKDPDSILVIKLHSMKGKTRLELVHAGVPDHDFKGVTQGWPKYYWKPWKRYLGEKEMKK